MISQSDPIPPVDRKLLLTKEEAAEVLSCCKNTIDKLEKQGHFRAIRLGKRFVRYYIVELNAYCKRAQEGAHGQAT